MSKGEETRVADIVEFDWRNMHVDNFEDTQTMIKYLVKSHIIEQIDN